MASITFTSVGKTYPNGHEALKDLTLQIDDGAFVVLVGPSGCGKSTALRIIAGLETPSAGEVRIGDRVVNDVEPKDRDIAMVFQNYALYPHMTVFRNMAFALSLRGVPRADIERRVHAVAQTLAISELLGRKPGELSGGQRQRVALGRAIVREPKAFLFDEPLSNLDAKLRVSMRAELKSLHQRLRTTSVYVTHDQEEAMTLGDRIVVMSKGVVRQQGRPLDVYRRPADRFVAGFVGTPPMNFFDGTLEASGNAVTFREPGKGGVALDAHALHAPRLRSRCGERVVLGLRPSAFRLSRPGEPGAWPVAVRTVEPLGDAADVRCSTSAHLMTTRLPAVEAAALTDAASLTPLAEEAHWFEPGEFGRSLLG